MKLHQEMRRRIARDIQLTKDGWRKAYDRQQKRALKAEGMYRRLYLMCRRRGWIQ